MEEIQKKEVCALLNIFMLKVVLLRLEGVFVDFFGRKVLSSVRD